MAKSVTLQAENREIARRKLVSYRAQCDIFRQLLKIVESAETRLSSVTAQYEEMRSSNAARDTMGDQLITLESQLDRLNRVIDEQSRALDEVLGIINAIVPENPIVASILSKRYLEPDYEPTLSEIADEMGYSEGYVKSKHLEGLDLVYGLLATSGGGRHG